MSLNLSNSLGVSLETACSPKTNGAFSLRSRSRVFAITAITSFTEGRDEDELLVVVGGGAAGIYGAIRAKSVAPSLNVLVIEKGKFLSKVKISGGGRCNVTNGHFNDNVRLAENYPRGNKELRGSFFNTHCPADTMSWFSEHGVPLKIEEDGRVFPVSDNSSSIVDCLLSEARVRGVRLESGKAVPAASVRDDGKFLLKVLNRGADAPEYVETTYLLVATGSSQQGYSLAAHLGHSIVDPVPSLFTFKVNDPFLAELAGVSFSKVQAKLRLEVAGSNVPSLTQVGPLLITHWGLSGPVILRLSAWGARYLFNADYKGLLIVDFIPDFNVEDVKSVICQHKQRFPVTADTFAASFFSFIWLKWFEHSLMQKQKVCNSYPPELGLVKRFWRYILSREGSDRDTVWASLSNNSLSCISRLLKHCTFQVTGKGQYKDEFVTAGGVPLSEISLKTMESKLVPNLFFAGEVLNIDGVTGGFNFQNAWSGGYIAGTRIGELATTNNVFVG